MAKEIRPSNFACYCHVVPDRFWLMTLNQTCGLLLRWYRDNFGEPEVKLSEKEGKDVFDLIISKSKPDIAESMILPHFVGSGTPWIDARSKGAIVGLSIHTNKADIIRAILEGVIYEQKISIDIFEKYRVDIKEIRVVEGGSKSRFWLQIRSDILVVYFMNCVTYSHRPMMFLVFVFHSKTKGSQFLKLGNLLVHIVQ